MTNRYSRRALPCALLATTALATPAFAQAVTSPTFRQADDNGVDLVRGDVATSMTEGSIGSGIGELKLLRSLGLGSGSNQWDRVRLDYIAGNGTYVDFGTRNDKFPGAESRGATISGSGTSYQYTAPDGTVVAFQNTVAGSNDETTSNLCMGPGDTSCFLVPSSITQPNGEAVTLAYDYWTHCFPVTPPGQPLSPDDPIHCDYVPRLKSVANKHGYQIIFTFADARTGGSGNPPLSWYQRSGAGFYNTTISPTTPQASISYSYPSTDVTDITDMGGRVWRVTDSTSLLALRRPGATSDTTSYVKSGGVVTSVTKEGVTKTYSRSVVGRTATLTITDPLSHTKVITSDLTVGRPSSIVDELGHTTSYQYDTSGRPTRVTLPEGNYTQATYDSRGNVTESRNVAKSGSGLADIAATASFDTSCSNVKTCNQPNWTKDAKGNQTDYIYDATHGGVLKVTKPAPAGSGVRPEVRNSYTLTNGVYLLTGSSTCQTTASCSGLADEAKTSVIYDASGNVTSTTSGDGTGTLSATTAATYDAMGNPVTVDGPLAGSSDTSKYRYDSARQLIGITSPDPDGSGPLKNRAIRITYRTDGQISKKEIGTVNSQSDTDWASFATLQTLDIGYWSDARPITNLLSSAGTYYAYSQMNYDALGRPVCTAVRMNPANWGSLPGACSLSTAGSYGPDRISQVVYDNASRVTQIQSAVGTSDAANERTMTFSNNGKLASLKDAENNLTTYVYDGFDRLLQTQYPSATMGAGSSNSSDYEQLSYDTNSNVSSRRLRDGNSIGLTYDNLNRITVKTRPSGEPAVYYTYDNLDRPISVAQGGGNAAFTWTTLSFTWDALGRRLTEVGPEGTVTSAYDLAGRRTQITYPGSGLYVSYDYLVTGEANAIRENGATSNIGVLASYGYDNLGNRISTTFGNGTSQTYGYDPISRLTSLSNHLSGLTNDLTTTFAYNPSSQITSTVRTGDAYAWTGHGNGSTSFTENGLNQQVTIGGSTAAWDTKGNLTSEPQSAKTYCYSSENLLTGTGGTCTTPSVPFAYDPALRLYQIGGASTARFAYDGVNAIAEYDGGNALQHRYVFAPGVDRPIVQYDGSGTSTREFMGADERGSIISLTDNSGTLININRYDEYGKPQSTNQGRFQYTGQKWIGEANLYDYKARDYLPHLGIFAQTDPLGYGDTPNLHSYVSGDPVNMLDPEGLEDEENCAGSAGTIVICGTRPFGSGFAGSGTSGTGGASGSSTGPVPNDSSSDTPSEPQTPIVITAPAPTIVPGSIVITGARIHPAQFFPWAELMPHLPLPFDLYGTSDCACFEAGTLVATPTGLARIEKLAIGDMVLSENERTGSVEPKRVTQLIRANPKPIYELIVFNDSGRFESFHATSDHRWRTMDHGWVATINLTVGEHIKTDTKSDVRVEYLQPTGIVEPTYNLEVADWHTFLVGRNHVLVHNGCPPAESPIWQRLKRVKGRSIKTDGSKYYSYDRLHGSIEVFDGRGNHLEEINAVTGARTKGPNPNYHLDVS